MDGLARRLDVVLNFHDQILEIDMTRRILLAVTGLSPQIVTETLYALAVARDPPWIPDEIRLITTGDGENRARLSLLSAQPGWFRQLIRGYGLPEIRFDGDSIHAIRDARGKPLDDIRSPEDNLLAADFITEKVRELTADADAELHVSIAGGRKTMGFFLGYALSLFGRSQDRLSHVLVGAPFESSWQFFYPTPFEHIIETHDKKLVDARKALVSLADIPFVSLRHGLPGELLDGCASYAETIRQARQNIGPATLKIDLRHKRIHAGSREIALPPGELALLAVFARRAARNESALPAPRKSADFKEEQDLNLAREWKECYLCELRQIVGAMADLERTETALHYGLDGNFFSQHKAKLHRLLERHLGKQAAAPYLIDDDDGRPRRYRLKLAPENIRFV
jgi:CRISPR-associated protein (TIGR02584 family)